MSITRVANAPGPLRRRWTSRCAAWLVARRGRCHAQFVLWLACGREHSELRCLPVTVRRELLALALETDWETSRGFGDLGLRLWTDDNPSPSFSGTIPWPPI